MMMDWRGEPVPCDDDSASRQHRERPRKCSCAIVVTFKFILHHKWSTMAIQTTPQQTPDPLSRRRRRTTVGGDGAQAYMLVGVMSNGNVRCGGGEGDTFDTPLFLSLSLLLCLSVSLVMSPVEAHYLHSAFIQTINYVIYEQWSPHFTLLFNFPTLVAAYCIRHSSSPILLCKYCILYTRGVCICGNAPNGLDTS